MTLLNTAELYTHYINVSRDLNESHKLTILQLEIMCVIYIKTQQGYHINPSDIFNLTTYRYAGEIYKQTKKLVELGYVEVESKKRLKRDKKYYTLSPKGKLILGKLNEV